MRKRTRKTCVKSTATRIEDDNVAGIIQETTPRQWKLLWQASRVALMRKTMCLPFVVSRVWFHDSLPFCVDKKGEQREILLFVAFVKWLTVLLWTGNAFSHVELSRALDLETNPFNIFSLFSLSAFQWLQWFYCFNLNNRIELQQWIKDFLE